MLWKKDVCLVVQVGGDVVHAGQLSAAAGRARRGGMVEEVLLRLGL